MADLYNQFLTIGTDFTGLPSATNLVAGSGIAINSSGANEPTIISVSGPLGDLIAPSAGFVCFNASTGYTANSFINGTGISVTNGTGQGGVTTQFNMIPNSTVQQVTVGTAEDAATGSFPYLKFAANDGLNITVVSENAGANALITIGLTGSGIVVGTVTSVGISSSTGVRTGGGPITNTGTLTVNLPGSTGGGATVAVNDLLVGSNTGTYAALSIEDANIGDVLTYKSVGAQGIGWSAASTAWYNVPNPGGDAGADVPMGAHAFTAVGALQLTEVASLTQPAANLGTFWLDNTATNNPRFSNSVVNNQYVTYTNALPTGGAGQVLTWQGGTNYGWAAPGAPLPSGIVTITYQGPGWPEPWSLGDTDSYPLFYIEDDQITANSVILVSGIGYYPAASGVGYVDGAAGHVVAVLCPLGLEIFSGNKAPGFFLVSDDKDNDSGTQVAYAIIKY